MSSRDVNQAEKSATWAHIDLVDAKIRQKKGNCPAFAGLRQQGRADARAAKRRRAKANRRVGKLICRDTE